MKQQLKQKTKSVEAKIKQKLKQIVKNIEAFKFVEKKFRKANQKLIEEVIDLRRIKNPDYSLSDFFQEKEIENYTDFIEKYIPYKELSTASVKLYHEGKIDNADAMVIANLPKPFIRDERQNKIVAKIVTKQIKARELISKTNSELYELIGEEENVMEEYKKLILQSVYHINHASSFIIENKKKLNIVLSKKDKEKLKDNFFKLKNSIQFGLKIKL